MIFAKKVMGLKTGNDIAKHCCPLPVSHFLSEGINKTKASAGGGTPLTGGIVKVFSLQLSVISCFKVIVVMCFRGETKNATSLKNLQRVLLQLLE